MLTVIAAFVITVQYFTFPEYQWIDTQVVGNYADMGSCEVAAEILVLQQESDEAAIFATCEEE